MRQLITRRKLLVVVGLTGALGVAAGTSSAEETDGPMTVAFDATNIRGYWASNRNRDEEE